MVGGERLDGYAGAAQALDELDAREVGFAVFADSARVARYGAKQPYAFVIAQAYPRRYRIAGQLRRFS